MRGGAAHAVQVPSVFDAISDDSEDEHPMTPSTTRDARNYSPTSAADTVFGEGPVSPEDRLRHVSSGKGFQLDVALARQKMEREIEKLR